MVALREIDDSTRPMSAGELAIGLLLFLGGLWGLVELLLARDAMGLSCGALILIALITVPASLALGWGLSRLYRALRRAAGRWALAEPTVEIDVDQLTPGRAFEFYYRQRVKRKVRVESVTFRLMWRRRTEERRSHRSFDPDVNPRETEVEHQQQIVRSVAEQGGDFGAGDELAYELAFEIPKGASPTHAGESTALQWLMRVDVEVSGLPDMRREYELEIT